MLRRQLSLRDAPLEQIDVLQENNIVERLIEILDTNITDINIQV
jgi:hypothetical protein